MDITKKDDDKIRVRSGAREALIAWATNANCGFDYGLTLTFEKDVENIERAYREFEYFIKRLNKMCFGNNWHRNAKNDQTKRIAVLAMVEGVMTGKRIHYHALIAMPKHIHAWQFEALVIECWAAGYYGGTSKNAIERLYDKDGWADYITKEIKENNCDALDATNTHIW